MKLIKKFQRYVRFICETSEKVPLVPFFRTPSQPVYDNYKNKKSIYHSTKPKQIYRKNN